MVLGTTNNTSIMVGIVSDTLVHHNCHIQGGNDKFLKSNHSGWYCVNVTNEGVNTVTAIYRSLPRVIVDVNSCIHFKNPKEALLN